MAAKEQVVGWMVQPLKHFTKDIIQDDTKVLHHIFIVIFFLLKIEINREAHKKGKQ
jgi:hypothetical protein